MVLIRFNETAKTTKATSTPLAMKQDKEILYKVAIESRPSTKVRWFDDNVVDGFAESISTQSVKASETSLAETQTGRINDYVSVVIFGIGILVLLALVSLGVI